MKRMFGLLILALSVFAPLAQSTTTTNAALRDAAGFLLISGRTATNAAAPQKPVVVGTTTNGDGEISSIASYILDDKHRLMAGDRVSFQIKEDQTNFVQLVVTESTELDIPYIGRVSVEDKTCKQLADELKVALEKDYYHVATVTIGLDLLAKTVGKVLVVGQVNIPGPVDIPPNEEFTVGKAILKAGGFKDFANRSRVQIIRKNPDGSKKEIQPVDLKKVFEDGEVEKDILVEPDDFILVPKRGIRFY